VTVADYAWQPTGGYLKDSRVQQFMAQQGIPTWQELIQRSCEDIEWFWNAALTHLGVEWFVPYQRLFDDSNGMPWTQWFPGGQLNIVHNCLDRHIRDGRGGKVALSFEEDGGESRSMTYGQLYEKVNSMAAALRHAGIGKGDRVAMCMPISPEAVTVMFAALKIGAVSMQPPARLAPNQIVEYLNQADARILFLNDGYPRAGREFSLEKTYEQVVERVPTLWRIVVLERLGNGLARRSKCVSWDDFLLGAATFPAVQTEKLEAEQPALILYSSGTTGKSKTIVHTHGGALAQIAKEVGYAFDCREDDVFYWFTNIGWMMAPWEIIGALFFGAALLLYEGTHLHPTPRRVFKIIERYGVTIFGFTPTAMRELANLKTGFGLGPRSTIRILGSTGSPLDPETWNWFFKTFGAERCPIVNISGGTEIIGCFVSPLPVMPLKPGSVGGPGLGMALDVCDDQGAPVRGQSGQLVCRKPFPSMTRGFLGDSQLYLNTYFPRGPSLWIHGDRALIDEDGCWFLLGRTDDLIVRGGVKFDPGILEAKLCEFAGPPRVKEAAVIGADDPTRGERIVAFVVLDSALAGDLSLLQSALQAHVKEAFDPLAQPDQVYVVNALPINLAAKIPRKLIRMVVEGKELTSAPALANPEALEQLRQVLGR
jgi:acetyl-CoA synthetase